MTSAAANATTSRARRCAWLPAPGTAAYHLLLLALDVFVLNMLGSGTTQSVVG